MQGEFSLEGRYPEVRSNVKLVQGLFNESLPKFIKSYYKVRNPVDITYLHIDCDLYQGKLLSHHMPNAKCHRMCLHQHTHQTISGNKVLKAMMAAMFGHMHIQYFQQFTACTSCLLERHRHYHHNRQYCDAAGAIEALTLLDKYIAPGCILLFDDLVNYPGYREHEILALWEWLEETGRKLEVRRLALYVCCAQSQPSSSVRKCTSVSVSTLHALSGASQTAYTKHFACTYMCLTVAICSFVSCALSPVQDATMAHKHNCRDWHTAPFELCSAMLPDYQAQHLFCDLA